MMAARLWFIPLALVALARNMGKRPRPFTAAQLLAWEPALKRTPTVMTALRLLRHAGLLRHPPAPVAVDNRNPTLWQLTPAGAEAARAAMLQAASQARAATITKINQRPRPGTLGPRLWSLLRIRQTLTSDEAAGVLADAGDDVVALQRNVNKYLRQWHKARPDAVQISAKRVGACLRFVLVKDIGPTPPKATGGTP